MSSNFAVTDTRRPLGAASNWVPPEPNAPAIAKLRRRDATSMNFRTDLSLSRQRAAIINHRAALHQDYVKRNIAASKFLCNPIIAQKMLLSEAARRDLQLRRRSATTAQEMAELRRGWCSLIEGMKAHFDFTNPATRLKFATVDPFSGLVREPTSKPPMGKLADLSLDVVDRLGLWYDPSSIAVSPAAGKRSVMFNIIRSDAANDGGSSMMAPPLPDCEASGECEFALDSFIADYRRESQLHIAAMLQDAESLFVGDRDPRVASAVAIAKKKAEEEETEQEWESEEVDARVAVVPHNHSKKAARSHQQRRQTSTALPKLIFSLCLRPLGGVGASVLPRIFPVEALLKRTNKLRLPRRVRSFVRSLIRREARRLRSSEVGVPSAGEQTTTSNHKVAAACVRAKMLKRRIDVLAM